MSKTGQNNIKGVNFQAWAALSLFLQFLKKPEFSHIQLEGEKLEDFTLYFNDGTKIIGEAKVRKERVKPALLKDILKNISKRKTFSSGDKILITCTGVSDDLLGNLQYVEYSPRLQESFIKKFKYPREYLPLLSKVDFWVVDSDVNKESIRALVSEGSEVWLPQEKMDIFVDSLVQKFFNLSENGSLYYRNDFITDIQKLKNGIVGDASYYNPQLEDIEKQYDDLEDVLEGTTARDKRLAKSALSALSTNFGLMSFARKKLENKKIDDLEKWDSLWQMNKLSYFSYGIFEVFKKNIHTPQNRKYIVEYCDQYSRKVRGFYQDDYFIHNSIGVLQLVLQNSKPEEKKLFLVKVFEIISNMLKLDANKIFYIKKPEYDGHDKWEKEEVAKLLKGIYFEGDTSLKKKIVDLVWGTFNLTEDEDELLRKVPLEIYQIVKEWLEKDFNKNLKTFIKNITSQYHSSYGKFSKKSKSLYDGWQHMGGTTSFGGSHYTVGDRHFVSKILREVFEDKYGKNPEPTWTLIKKECVFKENEVSETKPDFLNRSVLGIVVARYASENNKISDETFGILKEFILQRKGIPHKSELVYQEVARSGQLVSDDKKMRLVKVVLDKYKIPTNPFVEEIIRDLAFKGNTEAKEIMLSWFHIEDYYSRGRIGGSVSISSIERALDFDFDFGIQMLRSFIKSPYFTEDKFELFETYDVARALAKITSNNPDKGIEILNEIASNDSWGRNERALFCFGLYDHHEKIAFSREILQRIYEEVVMKFLKSKDNNIHKIVNSIPESGFREAFVKFADYLAKHPNLLIPHAMMIISVFIDDPDPYLPGEDPDVKNEEYNEHKRIVESAEDNHSITSVRGWCSWVLMKCCVLEGRPLAEVAITFAKRLLSDKNYYGLSMASFALAQLARVRLTYTEESKKTLFLDNDPKKALEKSKEIERMAFEFLDKVLSLPEENARKVLGKSVLRVFDPIRTLNEKEAKLLLSKIQKLPFDVQEEAAALFLYYAFFRKESYKEFKFARFKGLYDDIKSKNYNSEFFEKLLVSHVKNLQRNDSDDCFKIVSNIHRLLEEKDMSKSLEQKYYDILLLIGKKYGHNTSQLIQRTAISMLGKSKIGFTKWFNLLKTLLLAEKDFYREKGLLVVKDKMPASATQYYWYPSMWNQDMLNRLIKLKKEKEFFELIRIILDFPLGFELHIDGEPIEKLKKLSRVGKVEAKQLLKKLYDFDPGKWRYLKEETK